MAIRELVIKIPDNYDLSKIQNGSIASKMILNAVANGTLLPKGHGRLGDLDALEVEMSNGIKAGLMIEGYENYSNINNVDDCLECVKYADAIIEADRGEEE